MREDVNDRIARNILNIMREQGRRQVELADGIGVSKQILSKMLNGGRGISAYELKRISAFLNVPMERIMRMTEENEDVHSIEVLKKSRRAMAAMDALMAADEISRQIMHMRKIRDEGMAEGGDE